MKWSRIIILVSLAFVFLYIGFLLENNDNFSDQEKENNTNNFNYFNTIEDNEINTSNVFPNKLEWSTIWKGRSYDSSLDYGYGIVADDYGNIYVCGTSNSFGSGTKDIFLLKYNVTRELEWTFIWGGLGEDECKAIAVDRQNNIYLVGYTNSFTSGEFDACIIKVNRSGIEQWNRKWDYWTYKSNERAYGICIDSNDNIFVCVSVIDVNSDDYDIAILKYNSAGNLQWYSTYGYDRDNEYCYTIKCDLNDGLYIGGTIDFEFGDHSAPLFAKFNKEGVFQWIDHYFVGNFDIDHQVCDIAIDKNNDINILIAAGTDIEIIKYVEGSGTQWKRTWNGGVNDIPRAIALDKNDDIYISGMTNSEGAGNYDAILLKYNDSGALKFKELWGSSQYDGSEDIFIDKQSDIYLTGSTNSFGAWGTDVFILKYDNLNNYTPNLTINSNLILKGFQNTLFNFSVIYKDFDDNSPLSINVTINSTTYPINKVNYSDMNYKDGCDYQYLIYLPPAVYNYTYKFECSDGYYYNSTQTFNNLEVSETNDLEPYLSNPKVSPQVGNQLTLYNFSVLYYDDDNNLPEYMNITINQTMYSMQPSNPSDNNVMDGTQYYFNTTLDFGYYKFQINCSDGTFLNSTDWILAPEVNPFYGIGGLSLLKPFNKSFIFTGNVNFTWISLDASFGRVNYTLQISNVTDFSKVLYEKAEIKEITGISNLSTYISYNSGLYYWRVRPTFGTFKGNWSDYFVFNLTYNEDSPSLSLPTVKPKIGDQFTQFNFTVVYSDPNDNYPFSINVIINDTSYSMSKINQSDNNYLNGCIYEYLTYLSPNLYNYTYFFNCYDGKYSYLTLNQGNLEVYESNYYIPYFLNPKVTPVIGVNSTIFNFTVWYYDYDNNLPLIVNITINDTTYLMLKANPLDVNAMNGILYYYNTLLDFGYYNYQINCSDISFSNSTEWMYAPEVNPFYGCEPITLLNPVNDSAWFTSLFNFNWMSLDLSNGARVNYTLQISNSSNFNYINFEKNNIKELLGITNLSYYVDFSSGLYYWRVCAIYGVFSSDWSDYFVLNLTYNENSPKLMFSSVDPKIGHQYTEFNFTVVYFDSDNNYPHLINVIINGSSYSMSKINPSDDNYNDGCLYQFLIYLSPSLHNYSYFFECNDGKYTNFTIILDYLEIKETSFFKPQLLNPLLNPLIGNYDVLFNYTVWYFDNDNNFPQDVNITINETIFSMVQVNPSDINATDGIEFYYNSTLDFGYYKFQIICTDGFQTNATGWILGPEVNPFYGLPNITIITPNPFQVYGNRTFSFELSITNTDYIDIWYTINNSDYYFASGLSDKVNRTLWESFSSGTLLINFYANNSLGYIGVKSTIIFKDRNFLYPKNAYAIVIGIEDYPGPDYDLYYCKDDAIDIRNLLINTYNFYPANIISLFDSAASSSSIYNAFALIKDKIYPNDIFFFYFSGHGGTSGGPSHFICPYNSIPSNPSAYIYDVDLNAQINLLNTIQKYILIDSCYSGGMINEGQASGRFFISACGSNELSYETHYLHNGIFTYFFLKSYFEAPDLNGDGIISMEEQFYYTRDETFQWAGMNLYVFQRPTMYNGIGGYAILSPQIGPIIASIIDNQINFTFTIYGQGKIDILNFTVCSTTTEIVVQSQNILSNIISIDGFGVYSGSIELSSGNPITGYEVYAIVSGYKIKVIRRTYGDSDGDGLCDLFEYYLGGGIDPRLNDTDNDGLNDYDEYYGITNPLINDTDSDGILDGIEVNFYCSNPISNDSDSDNLLDAYEAYISGTNLTNSDTDYDELSDYFELFNSSTNPLDSDSDNDYLLDGYEINLYGTDPNLYDTDGDGYGDGWEVQNGHKPLDPNDPEKNDNGEKKKDDNASTNIILAISIPLVICGLIITSIVIYLRKRSTNKNISTKTLNEKSLNSESNKISKPVEVTHFTNLCLKCGYPYVIGQNFCTKCGTLLKKK